MNDFLQCVAASGINAALIAQGRQVITRERADIHIAAALVDQVHPAIIAHTDLCESGFGVWGDAPNLNSQPLSIWKWDFGPAQINLGIAMESVVHGDYSVAGLDFVAVFGFHAMNTTVLYGVDGKTPLSKFLGDPVQHWCWAVRRLQSYRKSLNKLTGQALAEALASEKATWEPSDWTIPDYQFDGFRSVDELRVVRYTSPTHQPKRLELWRALSPSYDKFFSLYQK